MKGRNESNAAPEELLLDHIRNLERIDDSGSMDFHYSESSDQCLESQLNGTKDFLKMDLAFSRAENDELKDKLRELSEKLNKRNSENDLLRTQLAKEKEGKSSIEAEMNHIKKERDDYIAEKHNLVEEIATLRTNHHTPESKRLHSDTGLEVFSPMRESPSKPGDFSSFLQPFQARSSMSFVKRGSQKSINPSIIDFGNFTATTIEEKNYVDILRSENQALEEKLINLKMKHAEMISRFEDINDQNSKIREVAKTNINACKEKENVIKVLKAEIERLHTMLNKMNAIAKKKSEPEPRKTMCSVSAKASAIDISGFSSVSDGRLSSASVSTKFGKR